MTLAQLIKQIKANKPKDREGFLNLGLKLKPIGSGAFRETFEIKGYGIVVKIPRPSDYTSTIESNLHHAQQEIRAIRKTKQAKYEPLRQFLPEVYYTDLANGIIIMKKYKKLNQNGAEAKYVSKVLEKVFNAFFQKSPTNDADISSWNIGVEYRDVMYGQYKSKEFVGYRVFDLGMMH